MKRLLPIAIALFLCGCATPYQKKGFSGGYKETRLKKNVFRVSFKGNSFTDKRRASDFALLRCAELTLEKGFRFFAIAGSESEEKKRYTLAGMELMSIDNPRSFYTIHCFEDKPPDYLIWYEATYLARSLRDKYGIVERSKPKQ
ncbi:MAG: hypothetical protein GY849_11315 [Deltaproteobacteria bacterium]|nr:hypothetical protein [Deltaproteobacteria bacterium]